MNRIESYEFRARAMAMIKPVMQVLIVAALLAALPELITSVVVLRTGADPANYLQPVLDKISAFQRGITADVADSAFLREYLSLMEELSTAYDTFLQEKGAIFFGMLAFQTLLAPAMIVTLHGGLLDAAYKREVTLGGVMSRLRLSFRALLLFLWMMIRVYVWMLPGLAVMLLALFVPLNLMIPVLIFGMALSIIPGLRALLHYLLAPIALVDDPSLSLNGCIAASFRVMRRRKMELFCLEISFIGWILLVSMVSMMLLAMFGSVLGMALGMMAELLLTVYRSGAQVCFYTAYSGKPIPQATPAGEETNELN